MLDVRVMNADLQRGEVLAAGGAPHRRTVLSDKPDASVAASGLNATLRT